MGWPSFDAAKGERGAKTDPARKKLFANVVEMRRVHHQDTKTFPSGIVVVKYARA